MVNVFHPEFIASPSHAFTQGLSILCSAFYCMFYSHPLIHTDISVLVVLNALHLAFSLASVSDFVGAYSPARTLTSGGTSQLTVTALQNGVSEISTFTEP